MTASSAHLDSARPGVAPGASRLAFDRTGQGEPLVLLHGQGFSRRSFDPVVPLRAARREVIAVDLPGHGESPRQPKGTGSAPRDLAVAVGELLDELGLANAHVAGNSSGGWVALELGRSGVPYPPARDAIHAMASAPGFRETLRGLEKTRFTDGVEVTVPVTVAFGRRDRVLLPVVARRRDQLPDQTRWVRLRGCAHVPMVDDPDATAALLLQASDPDTASGLGKPVRRRPACMSLVRWARL